jgi:alpha-glucosidase
MKGEHWYQSAVLYHIYPLSFADRNSDGFGDLPGILSKLDYLESLGVNAVWLSPIYPSPMVDWGYDVADYQAVDPRFGTMADLERLIDGLHKRGMKLLLDFVPGHTSDQHPWFKDARSSRVNSKRDWYIWADGKPDGSPPNNWLSRFGGPAWTLDQATGQYYLHTFFAEQPDLNWRNTQLREVMHDVLRFWIKKGIDGFRTDAIVGLVKDEQIRDDPANPNYQPGIDPPIKALRRVNSAGQEELTSVINSFCNVLGERGDELLLSEIYIGIPGLSQMYQACREHPVHAPFNFNLMRLEWDARVWGEFIEQYESALRPQDLPNWVLGNHDQPRVASRLDQDRARLAAFIQLTLRGMPVIYFGDELGAENAAVLPNQLRDPFGMRVPGFDLGRDPERAPMAWDGSLAGGFSEAKPWLPLPKHQLNNVDAEEHEPGSMLSLYRQLIRLRHELPELATGEFKLAEGDSEDVLVFYRGRNLKVVANFAEATQTAPAEKGWKLLASTHPDSDSAMLEPYEGRLYSRKQP